MRSFRARTCVFAAAAAACVFLSSCGGKKDTDFVFKIGTANSSLCGAPLHVAIDLDLFKDEFG